uniref:Chaperone protein dnaJ n=1 Tax=Solanum tuberosum TaxID=4113 RepID=M1AIP6_SOLTU
MGNDYYAVLGLKKECTETELRNAYKKLALKWHPDRCSASGNSKFVDEAKKKFQAIQEAYSVLSDANKRFLYDVGVYDSGDDDDENVITLFFYIYSHVESSKSCRKMYADT